MGYGLILGGTKHFGLYDTGQPMWSFSKALRNMEDKLAAKLALPAGSEVLDAGCGMGDVASRLATSHDLRVTGVDILDFNVEEATRRAKKRKIAADVTFLLMNYSDLDLPSKKFDGVYTMETLVHSSDPAKALREFYRVLKPGGRLVLFEYSRKPDQDISKASSEALERINRLAAMPSFQKFYHGVLEEMLSEAGFEDIQSEDLTNGMLPMLHAFSILGTIPYAISRAIGRTSVNTMSGVEMWKHRGDIRYNAFSATKPGG